MNAPRRATARAHAVAVAVAASRQIAMDTDASSSSTPRCHGSSAVRLAMISMCPKQHWLDAITPWLFHHQQVTYLNVGANKGFNVWSMMQRMHLAENYTNRDWRAEMDVYMRAQGIRTCRSKGETECGKSGEGLCGVCGACKELPPTLVEIGDFAFAGCTNCSFSSLPKSVTKIGDLAFTGCRMTSEFATACAAINPDSI